MDDNNDLYCYQAYPSSNPVAITSCCIMFTEFNECLNLKPPQLQTNKLYLPDRVLRISENVKMSVQSHTMCKCFINGGPGSLVGFLLIQDSRKSWTILYKCFNNSLKEGGAQMCYLKGLNQKWLCKEFRNLERTTSINQHPEKYPLEEEEI